MAAALSSDRELAAHFDLANLPDAFYEDPFPYYHALREHEPVKQLPDGSYFLTRYDDLITVYKDAKTFSSDKTVEFKPKFGDSLLYEHHTTSLVFNDPPLHTRVRRLIAGALTARAIADMEPALVRLVDELLDEMERKSQVDLIEDFAAAIPIEVIGNLLNVPRDERGPLREWSLAILGALEPVVTPGAARWGNQSLESFLAYLETLIARRRVQPGDPNRDVLTRLIQGEADGERLSAKELLHNCVFLLNAGHETTTNLIGNGLHTLAAHPDARRRLVQEPELIRTAVDEILRFESSNQLGNRGATCPVVIGGVAIPQGASITLCIGAANRDPTQFENPDTFDITRTPNRHLAFAFGIHQCAGMNLAKLEGRIAISRFLARFPDYEVDSVVRGGRARFRGFLNLHATLERR